MVTQRSSAADDEPVTLKDIAREAGVAVSTVSRALNMPDRVNARTRDRVLAVATALDYRPGSPPTSRGTSAVGLFVPDVRNPFYSEILAGLGAQLSAAGYLQFLIDTEESFERENEYLSRIQHVSDGVVMVASRSSNDELRRLAERIPLVTINRPITEIPGVVVDDTLGITEAVEHLVALGHTHICYVAGPATAWADRHRRVAASEATQRLRVKLDIIGPMRPTRAAGVAAADAVAHSGATACIAYNDLLAIGMITRFASRGISVPGEVSVVGCDDIFGADFCDPPLTTIGGDLRAVGSEAGKKLIALMKPGLFDASKEIAAVPAQLLVRGSTGSAHHTAR